MLNAGELTMNEQRVQGAVDEVVGSARRHVGNLTGDTRTEVEGAAQQIKGKVETAVGKLKDNLQTSPATNRQG
jgi:uncharacterized protein YjbJ (UPF0337 family)